MVYYYCLNTNHFPKTMFYKKNIPPGYSLIEQGKKAIIVKDAWKERLLSAGIADPDFFLTPAFPRGKNYFGRGALKVIALPGRVAGVDERMVIRHFQRGGKIQKFIADLYFGRSRPLKELWVGYRARERGVPCAEIIAACHTKVWWKFHRGDLVTREIKDGKDLATYLKELGQPLTKEKVLEKRTVIKKVGELVRLMHDAGIFHGDLNLKNIILQPTDSQNIKGYLIDFDKSFVRSHLSEILRTRNLLRLNRSAEKFKNQGLPITRTDTLRLILAYFQNPPDFKARVKNLNQQYKRHMLFRGLLKKLSKLLG
ncbi:MAG TPA: lipopolysaccharide kinase InaA family protein [Thermodesulfobacteriota bacterium]|nr:lipopolysaccharide kinase InaA family protein [Thermodesulfobacteriota bacterium]